MRCEVCGRVVRVNGKLSEAQNPQEVELKLDGCCGCHFERQAEIARLTAACAAWDVFAALDPAAQKLCRTLGAAPPNPEINPADIPAMAHHLAKSAHRNRCIREHHAAMVKRTEFIAAGKSGDGDGKPLRDFPWRSTKVESFEEGGELKRRIVRGPWQTLTVADQKAQAVKTLKKLKRQQPEILEAVENH